MSGSARSAAIAPSHLASRSSALRASSLRGRVASSFGSSSRIAPDSTSAWIAAKLCTVCLGVASSSCWMRSAR
jgi:hypothetical protein